MTRCICLIYKKKDCRLIIFDEAHKAAAPKSNAAPISWPLCLPRETGFSSPQRPEPCIRFRQKGVKIDGCFTIVIPEIVGAIIGMKKLPLRQRNVLEVLLHRGANGCLFVGGALFGSAGIARPGWQPLSRWLRTPVLRTACVFGQQAS